MLINIYIISSDKLQLNNRNVTLEICLQSNEKTLSDHEINQVRFKEYQVT